MSGVGHTPVAWRSIDPDDFDVSVSGDAWFDGSTINGWEAIGNPDAPGVVVLVLDVGRPNHWEDDRAAQYGSLIAAAPELLEQAKWALAQLERWIKADLEGTPLYSKNLERLQPLRAAIAKAEAR